MFLFIHFIYQSLFLFCLLKLILFSKFNSFLPNLLSREHHIFHTVEIARFFRKKNRKQNKQKYCYFLQLKGCAHYSLLVDITHYWLFKFLVEVKFLVGRQISSRSLVNVNCKSVKKSILYC